MTPTRIQEIRQRFERQQPCEQYRDEIEDDPVVFYVCGQCDHTEDAHAIAALLRLWDTRDTALRALVQQWRDPEFWRLGGSAMDSLDCAEELDRLLHAED